MSFFFIPTHKAFQVRPRIKNFAGKFRFYSGFCSTNFFVEPVKSITDFGWQFILAAALTFRPAQ
jgi:hypothetical protein